MCATVLVARQTEAGDARIPHLTLPEESLLMDLQQEHMLSRLSAGIENQEEEKVFK